MSLFTRYCERCGNPRHKSLMDCPVFARAMRLPLAGDSAVPGEVSTARYSPMAIAVAKATGKLRIDADGLGWIHDMEPDLSEPEPGRSPGRGEG